MIEIKGRKSPLELATQITRSFVPLTEMTERREMIFLVAVNHQRTPKKLLGKGNQFLCQQRNPQVSSPFRVASEVNPARERASGRHGKAARGLVLSATLSRVSFRFACYSRATSHDFPRRDSIARLAYRFPEPQICKSFMSVSFLITDVK